MTDHERQQYADEPEMLALIQAVRSHEFQRSIMYGVFGAAPARSREEYLQRAAELIEQFTERLRREDIQDLLRRVDSGEVELMIPEEAVE